MRLTIAVVALVMAGTARAESMHHTRIDFRSPSGICVSLADAANFEDAERNKVFSMGPDLIRETFHKCMATIAPGSAIDPVPVFDSAQTCASAESDPRVGTTSQDFSDCLKEETKDRISVSSLWKSVDAYGRAECILIQPSASAMPYMILNTCLEGARDHAF